MARKHSHSFNFFDTQTVTATTESTVMSVGQMDYGSIALSWSASDLTATLEVQARNGKDETYRALDFGGSIAISGASGSHEIVMNQMPFTDIKLVLTVTGGTSGVIEAPFTSKSTGA